MSIAQLLQAAEWLERREREAEHGYASTMPMPEEVGRRKIKTVHLKKAQGSRSTHNELEKNRRAHLRNCLERLKDVVPVGGEASRHTTLGLLTKAKHFIKNLEEKDKRHKAIRETLFREQRHLKRRLETLGQGQYREPHERSISECSSSSNTSTSSTASASESDEVDILGSSDSEDHSSIHSSANDINTMILSLCAV